MQQAFSKEDYETKPSMAEVRDTIAAVAAELEGKHPATAAGVIAEITALLVVMHPDDMREIVVDALVNLIVRRLRFHMGRPLQ